MFSCRIAYYGYTIPDIDCMDGENKTLVPVRASEETWVSSTYDVPATAVMNMAEISCYINYTDAYIRDPPEQGEATNVPECEMKHTFPAITVYCTYYLHIIIMPKLQILECSHA